MGQVPQIARCILILLATDSYRNLEMPARRVIRRKVLQNRRRLSTHQQDSANNQYDIDRVGC